MFAKDDMYRSRERLRSACLSVLSAEERDALAAVYIQAEWLGLPNERSALEEVATALNPGGGYKELALALRSLTARKPGGAAMHLKSISRAHGNGDPTVSKLIKSLEASAQKRNAR